MIGIFILSLKNLKIFIDSVYESFSLKINYIRTDKLFEIIVMLLTIISCILYISFIIFPGKINFLTFQKTQEKEFEKILTKLDNEDLYKKIAGLTLFLLNFRLFKFFVNLFPSFGILMQTLKYAYKEIFAYFFLISLMILGISGLAHSNFGSQKKNFESISSTIYTVYLLFIGIFSDEIIKPENTPNELIPILIVFFMLKFYLM